jgi:hypothetical protein
VHVCPNVSNLNSYANYFTLSESSNDLNSLGRKLMDSLKEITDWAEKNKLAISVEKSHVTLFMPWNHELNKCPQVLIDGVPIQVNMRPKILGLTYDPLFTMTPHLGTAKGKGSSRLQLLKATAGQDFGDKETLKLTY